MKNDNSVWPTSLAIIFIWISLAAMVGFMSHCTYKKIEAQEETYRTKSFCIN